MFRNYLLLAFRNFRKNKLHTFINIAGMMVAFACSIFILLLVFAHFTWDDFHKNKKDIYIVYSKLTGKNGDELSTSMAYPMSPALKDENIGIIKSTRLIPRGKLIRAGEKTLDMQTTMVDPDFFSMFSFPVVAGNAVNPLASISDAVITETTAKKLFGETDAVGKPIEVKLNGEWIKLTVSAVTKDFPINSSIKFDLLARTEINPDYAANKANWDNQHHTVFVQLAPNTNPDKVEQQLRFFTKKFRPDDLQSAKANSYFADSNGDYFSFRLESLGDIHFNSALANGGSTTKAVLFTLILISAVILLIASFNFVNLNVGLSFSRSKEIGIRKCLGAGKQQIWLQVWGESFMMVIFSMIIAIAVSLLLITSFNQTFGNKLDQALLLKPSVIFTLIGLVVVVSFIASGYPSSILARLKTTEILKGKITVKGKGGLRNALIVAQFVIAITLICCTIIIYQQFNHLRRAPLGYNTNSIISIPIKNDEHGTHVVREMRNRLSSDAAIVSVTGSNTNLGVGEDHSRSTAVMCFEYGGKPICGQVISTDYDVLKTINIKPVEGHDFTLAYSNDTSRQVIVSESYAAQFEQKSMAGFSYYIDSSEGKITVAGVIPDFQLIELGNTQKPLVIELNRGENLRYVWVKVNTTNPLATMERVRQAYSSIEPGVEFKGSYVNENIDRWFTDEKAMGNIFSWAAGIAVLLSSMGLFGIASIVIRQRVKEIGVRKVLGATVNNIVGMVGREFLRPVVVAFVIAVPIAWMAMHAWLKEYAYRIDVQWWVFLVTGVLAILITILTISFQSIKAALANPVKSLRTE